MQTPPLERLGQLEDISNAVSFFAGHVEWLLVFGVSILFSLAIFLLAAILGLIVQCMEAANWIHFIVPFSLTFVSNAFVLITMMSAQFQPFAENQPPTHEIPAMRAWLIGTPVGNSAWLAFAWCVGIITVAIPIATWLFRRQALR